MTPASDSLSGVPSARLRRLLFVSVGGFFGFLAIALVSAALSFRGPAEMVGLFRLCGIAGAAGGIIFVIGMGVFGIAAPRRFERELIHRTIQADLTDVGQMPSMLIGQMLTADETLALESEASGALTNEASDRKLPRSAPAIGGLILVVVGVALFLLRTIALAASAGSDGGAVLWTLLGGTALAIAGPTITLLSLGALRDRAIRHSNPGAVLVRTLRTPPLEFSIIRIDHGLADHIRSNLVWSFDVTGATLWQGRPSPRQIVHIPRARIVGIGLQESAEQVNALTYDRLALVANTEDQQKIVIPFIVRPKRSPLMAMNAAALQPLRAQILDALGS